MSVSSGRVGVIGRRRQLLWNAVRAIAIKASKRIRAVTVATSVAGARPTSGSTWAAAVCEGAVVPESIPTKVWVAQVIGALTRAEGARAGTTRQDFKAPS